MSSFFYLQAEKTTKNRNFIDSISDHCEVMKTQAYILDRPLGDNKYSYAYSDALVLLIPKHQIVFINFREENEDFEDFVDDFIEDLGSISDKYRYKESIGRPKVWKTDLICKIQQDATTDVAQLLNVISIDDPSRQRVCELLISLLTGSINDIDRVKADIPETLLDKVKQKILLFDGDQTRFVYQPPTKPSIRIQGLSGTGKTELLLHKLKEIYVTFPECRIAFTCHIEF